MQRADFADECKICREPIRYEGLLHLPILKRFLAFKLVAIAIEGSRSLRRQRHHLRSPAILLPNLPTMLARSAVRSLRLAGSTTASIGRSTIVRISPIQVERTEADSDALSSAHYHPLPPQPQRELPKR